MDKTRNGALKGAIVGDIVGSIYEFNNHRSKDFPLFGNGCDFTDDTVMSVAVAYAIGVWAGYIEDDSIETRHLELAVKHAMQKFGNDYPGRGYGKKFLTWLYTKNPQPYNSWGNGAPMRCSAAGMIASDAEDAYRLGKITAVPTHNHQNAMLAAGLTAELIWRARHGESMEQLRQRAEKDYEIKPCSWYFKHNVFSEASHLTMPPALSAFLESTSFEDCIRNCMYVGGDSDTIGAIAGAMAEAYWGIPDDIWAKAESYLDERLKTIVRDYYAATVEKGAD
ncbi:MAG: ADP-ribosylglycohydrolase family protein [Oscillospiraceae bacterium]|nr:ADP-ribosylglycohydrolase family protein [Oscillospiraceae bacterium]